ncbi:Hypothetical predicted protein [Octopus vulgaris]|uniref:Uncharacterized protein n=1 Tax=Octopus vulgaris TaxID=6645 RepID=A0AA36FCA3_OCTVU|nr:Hypothetical predicted protein [Octopus vulgaris]
MSEDPIGGFNQNDELVQMFATMRAADKDNSTEQPNMVFKKMTELFHTHTYRLTDCTFIGLDHCGEFPTVISLPPFSL